MRKKICPQCEFPLFFVLNAKKERCVVYVYSDGTVVPKHPDQSLEGYNTDEVYCMGCSWHGSPKRLR